MPVSSQKIAVVLFSGDNCSICQALKPKVGQLMTTEFPEFSWQIIDIASNSELASQHSVFTVPVLLILVANKEYYRFVHSFSTDEIQAKLQRLKDLIAI